MCAQCNNAPAPCYSRCNNALAPCYTRCILPPFFPSPKYTPPIFLHLEVSSPHSTFVLSNLPPQLSPFVHDVCDLPPFKRLQPLNLMRQIPQFFVEVPTSPHFLEQIATSPHSGTFFDEMFCLPPNFHEMGPHSPQNKPT